MAKIDESLMPLGNTSADRNVAKVQLLHVIVSEITDNDVVKLLQEAVSKLDGQHNELNAGTNVSREYMARDPAYIKESTELNSGYISVNEEIQESNELENIIL